MSDQWPQPNSYPGSDHGGPPPERNAGVPAPLRDGAVGQPLGGSRQPGGGWEPVQNWQHGGPQHYGGPQQGSWGPGGTGAAMPGANRRMSGSAAVDPGWLSRLLLWAGIVVVTLPSIVVLPFVMRGDFSDFSSLYTVVNVIAGIVALLLAGAAFLLLRNTTWARRLIGGGIYILAGILTLTLTPLLSLLVTEALYRFDLGMWLSSLVLGAFSAVMLSAKLIAWCIGRNRRWWLLLVAAGCGVLILVVSSLAQMPIGVSGAPYWLGASLVNAGSLLLDFGALGLLHLLGGTRAGSVPVNAQPTIGERRPFPAMSQSNYPASHNPAPRQNYPPTQNYTAQAPAYGAQRPAPQQPWAQQARPDVPPQPTAPPQSSPQSSSETWPASSGQSPSAGADDRNHPRH